MIILSYGGVSTLTDEQKNNSSEKLQLKIQAFNALSTWSRLLIAVAAGILVLSITFIRGQAIQHVYFLGFAWGALILSIVVGFYLVGSMTAHLNEGEVETLNAQDPRLILRSTIQWLSFLAGIVLFCAFGFINLF